MSAAFGTQAFQQSRHARRIYVGGFPPNYGDEEALKFFLNSVIAKGLGEPNDNSYVLSIYVNQKKCFAFVELRAIELATACLDLDGIIYKKVVLKVLRANEYKPELIPPSMVGAPITLDLSSFSFGIPTTTTGPGSEKGNTTSGALGSSSSDNHEDARMDSVIQFASLPHITPGTISIIGYPFDDRAAHPFNGTANGNKDSSASASSPHSASALISHSNNSSSNPNAGSASTGAGSGGYTGLGCTQAPKKMRNLIRKYKFGLTQNPEYQVDLTRLKYVDLGDVQVGKTREETKLNLASIVGDVLQRRAVPFVIGGSSDCGYFNALGVLSALESRVGMVVLSAQIDDTRVLDDGRFCPLIATSAPGASVSPDNACSQFNMLASHSGSCISLLSDHGGHSSDTVSGQQGSELDISNTVAQDKPKPNCGGRYVRFAAQGSQVSKLQSSQVLDKGGHIVWLSKDIRNQSPACTVLPSARTSDDALRSDALVTAFAVPHLHTLKLFQQALRCAAGLPASYTSAEKVSAKEDSLHIMGASISRQDSTDTCDTTAPSDAEPAPLVHGGIPLSSTSTSRHHTATAGEGHGAGASAGAIAGGASADPVTPGAVVVSIDMGVMSSAVRGCGYITGSSSSTTGLTVDEILDIVMLAGADPNVISLDISEFSPDAEDTRSNMLLAQMFYQFSLGVASRPSSGAGEAYHATKDDRRAAAAAGVEVEAFNGSFILTDSSYMARLNDQKDQGSVSRAPKYYQEVSSGSMELHVNPHGSHTAGNNGSSSSSALPTPAHHPYVEVDNRLSSMDAMDGPVGAAGQGISASTDFGYPRSVSSANSSVSSKQGNASPTAPMNTILSSVNMSSTESMNKQLYPASALSGHATNQRVNFPSSLDTSLMSNMIRTSPSVTPSANVTGVRRPVSSGSNSPPVQMRNINPAKIPPAGLNMSQLYPASAQQQPQRGMGPAGSHLSPQHQQMLAQQQAQQQAQQAQQAHHLQQQQHQQQQQQALYGQRPAQQYRSAVPTPQTTAYAPQTHSPQYGREPLGYQQSQQQQQRGRYESELQLEQDHAQGLHNRHGAPPAAPLGWNHGSNDRTADVSVNRYHSAQSAPQQNPQLHRQTPMHPTQSSQSPYLSSDFLDITGERIPGAGVASVNRLDNSGGGGYLDRMHSQQGNPGSSQLGGNNRLGGSGNPNVDLNLSLSIATDLSLSGSGSASVDKSRSLIRNNSNLSSSSLSNEIHSFEESIDLYEYRVSGSVPHQQRQAPGASRPIGQPPPIPQYQQQGSHNRAPQYPGAGGNTHNIYSLYGAAGPAPLSTDSMNFSSNNASSSMNSDIMSSLAGLASSGSGSLSNASSMLFPSPSPLGGHSQSQGSQSNQAAALSGQRQQEGDPKKDFLQDHYSQFS